MLRFVTALLICAAAEAATLNVNLAVNATLTSSGGTAYAVSGTGTLTGGISDTGTFTATLDLLTVEGGGSTPFTMTLSKGTMGGSLTIPLSAFEAILTGASSASGSATITSATGSYAGYTGTFPTLTGSGGVGSTGAITFMFTGPGTITTGGTVTNPPPTVTAVQNDASNAFGTAATVAQGSLFVVKGSNMSASGYNQVPLPYQTSFGGTTVTFTPTGGSGTNAYLFYTYNVGGVNQLGGIVPSTLKTGTYNLTVTYNNVTSANFAVTVAASNPGIFTQDTSGGGLGVVQNIISATQYDVDRLTTGTAGGYTISPSKPGQTIIVWATGLGPVPYADNIIPPQGYNYPNVQVIIGGTSITPLYAGASGYAGLDQINVTLPANISTGCSVALQVSVNGVKSPATTMAIAPDASSSSCTLPGYTATQLASLDAGGTITAGNFSLVQVAENIPGVGAGTFASASGGFTQITAFQLGSLSSLNLFSQNTIGSCTVTQETLGSNGQVVAGGGINYLDAGTVKLSGPSASNLNQTPMTDTNGAYSYTIGETGFGIPGAPTGTLAAGTYTVAGAGGTGVGSFNASISLGSPLTISGGGLPATVSRSQPLVLAWTGGNATDVVTIFGYSGSSSGTGANAVTTATAFVCTTTAGTGGFTVPTAVLQQLPATPALSANGSGFLEVSSGPAPVSFNAPLVPSGTVASIFSAAVGAGSLVTYQ